MLINDHIPVLTDLIEKGIEIKLSELGLDHSQDLILQADDREEPLIEATQLEFDESLPSDPLSENPALEQTIRKILDEHMALALKEINIAIQQSKD